MSDKKYFSRYKEALIKMPNLVENQVNSFKWLIDKGINEIFDEFSPIPDYSGKKFELEFTSFEISEPKYDEHESKEKEMTYEASMRVKVKLTNKTLGTSKEQELFMAEFPLMTNHGTFIINGVERVVVPQLARSFGVLFTVSELKGGRYFGAKIIPSRGAWLEIESDNDGLIYARIDRKRKFLVSSLLRSFASEDIDDKNIIKLFNKNEKAKKIVELCFEKDTAKNASESFVEIHKKLRDGEMVTPENAKNFVKSIFGEEKYNLSAVGRFRFNKLFGLNTKSDDIDNKILKLEDIARIINHIVELNNDTEATEDNIDHLGSRRVKYVGEMMQAKVRFGIMQMKRNIQDRMSTVDVDTTLPINLISPRPLQARIKEFFTTNQLSQFMNQANILSEIEHLRTLSALGPGGLTRERASLDVRDVHPSHYGRVCPIHTPEGPNIGLILHLSVYARINDFGMIETPYAKVKNGIVTKEIIFVNAFEEEKYKIAHGATLYDKDGKILSDNAEVRIAGRPELIHKKMVDLIDIAPNQAFSVATSMVPFLEHNDANRALMGSNMQKQGIPCIVPEVPLVATGMEEMAARDTGRLIVSGGDGIVEYVDSRKIIIKGKGKEKEYKLINFSRTNAFTSFHHRPSVNLGQKVKKGDILADTTSSSDGQIALGQNALIAFMSWDGSNYEDAIIISERLVKSNKFSSIKIVEFVVNVRDTKLGPEVTTHDIPNVGEAKLKDLDEDGIVRIGAEVGPNDILVGKITPKGETELTPEERLLRSIFGEKARDVKDSSKRMEHGKKGRVIGVKVFSRENGDNLDSSIIKRIHIEVAALRNVSVGDKLAGRHGNKGVISRILPEEEMPYMKDGTPIDIILTPLGVPSRMNLGQVLEIHLGLAANTLGYQAITPTFFGASEDEIKEELKKAGFNENGKVSLYDGRTGESFNQDISVGYMYMMKLDHMVKDKIHMRSIGPYSLITQQPLGGKAQGGGQRFGEMEVWALEGYGAAYTLREMLTIKSDDIVGRAGAFDSIVKGEKIKHPNIPASFNVLINNMKGLLLDIELKKKK